MAQPGTSYPSAGFPGPYSSYTPSHEATGGLIVGYSRNAKDFPVNNYIQIYPSQNMFGLYAVWTSRNAARIISNVDAEHSWADGAPAPPGLNNLESYVMQSYKTTRRSYPFTLGELTVQQQSFDLLMANTQDMAQQCMTARTMLVQGALSAQNWGSNTINVPTLLNTLGQGSGQNWGNGGIGTTSNPGPNIKRSLQYGIRTIHLQTIGTVRENKLVLVVNPTTAQAMAASTEIQDYIKQDQFALGQLMGNVPNQNGIWGLPTHLYGVKLVVEDAVRVSSNKGATTDSLGYVMPDGVAYLLARPGELQGIAGHRSYSTIQCFFYQDELTVETKYDADNKRYMGRVISNYVPVVATAIAGFQFNACLG